MLNFNFLDNSCPNENIRDNENMREVNNQQLNNDCGTNKSNFSFEDKDEFILEVENNSNFEDKTAFVFNAKSNENKTAQTIDKIIKKRKNYAQMHKNPQKTLKTASFDKMVKLSRVASKEEKDLVLTEYEDMQIWIKTMLSIYGSLPNIIKIIDQIIENQATNPFGASHFCAVNTFGQIEKVIDFYERKNKLLNIYVLIGKLFDGLNEEEANLVNMKFVNRITVDAIAQTLNIDRRSVYRKFNSLIRKLASFSLSRGWTTTFISNQLENEPWVVEQYNSFKKETAKIANKRKD